MLVCVYAPQANRPAANIIIAKSMYPAVSIKPVNIVAPRLARRSIVLHIPCPELRQFAMKLSGVRVYIAENAWYRKNQLIEEIIRVV
jgi:hypothetical protein